MRSVFEITDFLSHYAKYVINKLCIVNRKISFSAQFLLLSYIYIHFYLTLSLKHCLSKYPNFENLYYGKVCVKTFTTSFVFLSVVSSTVFYIFWLRNFPFVSLYAEFIVIIALENLLRYIFVPG